MAEEAPDAPGGTPTGAGVVETGPPQHVPRTAPADDPGLPVPLRGAGGTGDAVFRGLSVASGVIIVVLMAAIGAFLLAKAVPAIGNDKSNFLTTETWDPDGSGSFGIAALAYGTLLSSVLALIVAVPVAVGVALFISQYAPRRLAQALGYVIDLLAAVPSVVYGLWGLFFLNEPLITASRFLAHYFGFIPLFTSSNGTYGQSVFVAAILLAIMILPIIAAISREVFLQAPREHKEAAFALGSTTWEMIRLAVLPYGRSGVVSAAVLGLGRALGETIAVALVLSSAFRVSIRILDPGGNTIAANIANFFADAQDNGRGALIAAGLVLFVITLVVNFAARAITRGARRTGGLT